MARRKQYSQKEYDELQKLKHENKMLKKRVAALRKQISRIDIDRYQNLKDLVEKQLREDSEEAIEQQRRKIKEKWKCHSCTKGFLKLHILSRRDGVYYFRKCIECEHRTVTKPYTDEVESDE